MPFFQDPPRLENTFQTDPVLRSFLRRVLPETVQAEVVPSLERMGALAAGPLHELAMKHRLDEPRHVPFDAWGHRIDAIEPNAAWREYARVAAREGIVATAYERAHAEHSRLHQMALVYLFGPSSQTYTCPLAMTDGCARTLEILGVPALRDAVLPHLVSRDPASAWTSGQWMTERTGGSDVGLTETVARLGQDGRYRLFGTKWFTSAIGSEVTLTLARPEGNGPGGKGLALFFARLRSDDGSLNGIAVNRLKEKLGTRHLPTAELTLDGMVAEPVVGLTDGIRNMASMLNITRTWNAVGAVSGMQRGLAYARDYARRRVAFGAKLEDKPLHLDLLAGLAAEHAAGFQLAFHVVRLLGRSEVGLLSAREQSVLRVLHPLAKLVTAKQAVSGASEVLESFGGAGYVEDTGLPAMLRDAQVLSIWEGTTNVLALETLRALTREDAWVPLVEHLGAAVATVRDDRLAPLARASVEAAERALRWARDAAGRSMPELEAGARRFALTLGRATALALLVEHAEWGRSGGDPTALGAARRFARNGVDLLDGLSDLDETRALALGE